MAAGKTYKVRTPLFPLYSEVHCLVTACDGTPKAAVIAMIKAVDEHTGTPQNPVDWSDPDTWIAERLSGENATLARRIWEASQKTVNPRHIYGAYLFMNSYRLLVPDAERIYRLSDRGRAFLARDAATLRELDEEEGIPFLLNLVATKGMAQRRDFLPEWSGYLRQYSKLGSPTVMLDALWRRLRNMEERGLVTRQNTKYTISPAGLAYLEEGAKAEDDGKGHLMRALATYNEKQKKALRKRLQEMPPINFEALVRDLLVAMGYEDVVVTKVSGDKGVDVVAKVQFGITTITEVVQVKRHHANIGRPVLDQLRGALPYHKALRGTLITVGNFSNGCKEAALFPGAAPIGLINGDKLIELLVEHEIGITKRQAPIYEVDEAYFLPTGEEPSSLAIEDNGEEED